MGCRKGPLPIQCSHVLHVVLCATECFRSLCQDLMALAATACNSYLWGVACSRGQSEGKQHGYPAIITSKSLVCMKPFQVSSVLPPHGSTAGGTHIVLLGSGFRDPSGPDPFGCCSARSKNGPKKKASYHITDG